MSASPLAEFLSTADVASGPQGRSQIDAILEAVRLHLGMEIAYTSRYVGDEREFTHISSDLQLPAAPGDREPLEQSFCYYVLQGRLPELIHDARQYELAASVPIVNALPVGAHLNVPLRYKDGSIYGSFCCLSRAVDTTLTQRDLNTMRVFADLAMEQIERDRDADARRQVMIDRIQNAIDSGQPAIFLQPIHRLDTGRSAGCEALARFTDASKRPPNEWFDEAFEVGMGTELELAAIRNALAGAAYAPADHYVSINVSPETALSGKLGPMLEAAGRSNLVLEVTEHSGVEDYQALRDALLELRRYGRIAIDDFGAGYSSLRHIISLEPDILKLDMSLVRGIHLDPARRALASAMVGFAGRVNASIVAEGVELPEENAVLRDLGVTYGQGYLFSRPMPLVAAQQHMLGVAAEAEAPLVRPGDIRRVAHG
ncbi:EAL domain-containing protein [Sphingomonas sp. AOB5]|uniref:sensor domain-containing phosphodiesterase n=1 Tax=Sphingomonas sp. AOB5 TaxID=3034017 RepID=UPI0023F6D7D8|nr:EAL domain-containing protein [Sphingomonas sp. AOB5]MDF7775144.1 EAL domain-containing protein [Sphingomonas sp. AOB5]